MALLVLIALAPPRRRSMVLLAVPALLLGCIGALQVLTGLIPVAVAGVGLRSYVAPLIPLVIFLGYGSDVIALSLCRVVLGWLPLQLILGLAQAGSPGSAFINRQPSGEEAHFIQDGVVRIAGTFTAPAGMTAYIALSFAVALGALLARRRLFVRGYLIFGAVASGVLTLVSGSRGTVLAVSLVAVVVLVLYVFRNPASLLRIAAAIVAAGAAVYLLVSALWPQVLNAFISRFDSASRSEDSLDRVWRQAFDFVVTPDLTFFGGGIGSRSQAGISLGSGAQWVEIDTLRWVAELGILGWVSALIRLALVAWILKRTIASSGRANGWLAVSVGALLSPVVLYGSITQTPSDQGAFAVILIIWLGTSGGRRASDVTPELSARGPVAKPNLRA